jgi:colanic acid/amylovoran biosynthesis glycosyltransferase
MRIAYLITQYPKESHTFIRREIAALEALGVAVERIALRGWRGALPDALDRAERERTRYVLRSGAGGLVAALVRALCASPARFLGALCLALRMARGAERALPYHLAYLAEACVVARWMRAAGASHLHAHFGANSAEVAMLVNALGGRPYSFTVHGPHEFDRPLFIGLGEKVRRSAFVVAVSSFGRSQLYRWIDHRDWAKVKVIHCGLDAAYASAPARSPSGARRLACIGRLAEEKGQLLLVEAAASLAARGVAFELVLIGDGEQRSRVEALIARHGLQDRVSITGWLSGERVREELLACAALVLPSFAEGLPVALMEAMALRRPVLTTYVAGIPELVQPGETGWLFPAGSVSALAGAIEDFLSRPPAELRAMGEAARARVLARHSAGQGASRLAALFRQSAGATASV